VAAGSGLLTQFMLAEESTVGTGVTVTRGYEVDDLKPTNQKITAVSQGLRAGGRGHRERNRVITGKSATLNVPMSVFSKGFGVFLKHALGSSTTALIASATNRQIHLVGDLAGKGMTVQGGFAESGSAGVTRPYTYNGCKITDLEMSCRMDDLLKASVTYDAWNWTTATALATASFLSALEVFHWAELTVKIGGTPSTSAGRTTVSGNSTLNGLRGVTLRLANGLRTDRRFAGGAGIKSEQLENAFRVASGELDCEFFDRTQLNDVFDTDASTALVFQWVGVTSDAGNFPTVRVTYPRAKLDTGTMETNGPDIVDDRISFTAYEDDAGTHPLVQYEYESLDSAP
jgi:Phage tail tube protein